MPGLNTVDPKMRANAKKLNSKMPEASQDLNYVLTSNPVFCGLIAFNLITDFESAGIALCDWHHTIWSIAHLYSALRQMSLLSKVWPEMEDVLALHKEELFSGPPPASANEFYSCFVLNFGVTPASLARSGGRELVITRRELGINFRTT